METLTTLQAVALAAGIPFIAITTGAMLWIEDALGVRSAWLRRRAFRRVDRNAARWRAAQLRGGRDALIHCPWAHVTARPIR
ncbi:MAG: hypothetical protein ACXIUZ_02080 [Lysobacteraceae bacterium]